MQQSRAPSDSLSIYQRYKRLSPGKKAIIIIFLIWLLQAIPKWVVVIASDGETSAKIMRVFVTPRSEMMP